MQKEQKMAGSILWREKFLFWLCCPGSSHAPDMGLPNAGLVDNRRVLPKTMSLSGQTMTRIGKDDARADRPGKDEGNNRTRSPVQSLFAGHPEHAKKMFSGRRGPVPGSSGTSGSLSGGPGNPGELPGGLLAGLS